MKERRGGERDGETERRGDGEKVVSTHLHQGFGG